MTSNSLDFLLNLQANTSGFDQGINGAKFAVDALVGAMAALGVGLGVKELAEAADSYAMLSAKIQQSTKDSGNFEQAISGVHQIALQTNSTLDNTGALFTRLNTVAKDMGKSQQFALDMTSTVTKAIQLGGSSTQEAEAAVTQFIQAMQGGVLRGEEFNSIMEGGYGLAEALAKGLGKTTGELRKMAENGELSAERVLAALEKQKAGVDAQYAEMPLTIGNALQKIATSWQILIGEMDQANGASATVAQALSTIADNLGILKVFFDDVGDGFVWFRDQLKNIDPSTIEALKNAAVQAYDTVKTLLSTIGSIGESVIGAIQATGSAFGSLIDSFIYGGKEVDGLTKIFDGLRIAFALVSDGLLGINIAFKLVLGGVQFLEAGLLSLKAKIVGIFSDDWAAQVQAQSDALFRQAEKNAKEANRLALESKSATVEAIRDIRKTEDEKNAERIANNEKTLSDLKAQESKHVADYKAISDERVKLQQQLVDARKSGDQSAIDAALAGLAELDKKEKAYQAESKKISDEKIKAAQDWASAQIEAATKGGVALSDNAKKTIEAGVAAQGLAVEFDKTGKAIVKAIEQEAGGAVVSLEAKMGQGRKAAAVFGIDLDTALNKVSDGFTAKKSSLDDFAKNLEALGATGQQAADLVYQAWLKFLSEAKSPAEVDMAIETLQELAAQGKITGEQLKAGIDLAKASAKDLSPELDAAREAGKALGIDIDKTANIMSKGFGQGSANLDTLKQKLEEAGITGEEASNILYQGWKTWLEKVDSQVELDASKAKLEELAKTGQISASQLKDGLTAIEIKVAAVKDAANPAIESFKRLGIETKDSLAATAKQAESDFDRIKASGSATADGISKAYAAAFEAAAAAGDMSYNSWERWLAKATNPADAEIAKKILKDLGDSGAFSIYQVEKGLIAVDQQLTKMPNSVDPVTAAFKRLGIETKENLKLAAQQALTDYETVRNSGQATAEGIEKAYKRAMDAAAASGDASVIASANAQRGSAQLQVQIDETGKASVKSMDELSNSVEKVGRTASGSAADGFRELGRVAKQEAKAVGDTWQEEMDLWQQKLAKVQSERKAQAAETAKGLSQMADGQNSMAQDFYNQLIAGGMEQGRAEALKKEAMTRMNNQLRDALSGGTAQGRIDAMTGRNASKDWMDNILKLQSKSGSVSSPKTPSVQAPNVNTSVANVPSSSAKTVTYKIEFGGKSLELAGDPNQQNLMNDFLSELEQLNRAR